MVRCHFKVSSNAPALCLLADHNEPAIKPILLDKLLMRSFLNDLPLIHHQNLVSVFNRCQTVSNDNDRFPNGQLADGLLDQMLVFGVNACGCLVKNDNIGILQDCAGDGNTLLFRRRTV